MNHRKHRYIAIITAAVIILSIIAACTSNESSNNDSLQGNHGSSQDNLDIAAEIAELELLLSDDLQGVVLTIATFNPDDVKDTTIRDAIDAFCSEYPGCCIEVVDYSQLGTGGDHTAGLMKLSTELITGNGPDILDVSSLPYKEYAARGFLADLYGFIDADPEFNRSDLVEGALHAAEIDGKLYQLFPSFHINAIYSHPSIVGTEMGWTMDEFRAVLDAHPEADIPLGMAFTKQNFLQTAVSTNIYEYIDWNTGTVSFDSAGFIQLLEFAATFPDEVKWGSDGVVYVPPAEAIPAGRQIMHALPLYDFDAYQRWKGRFGGELTLKAFPSDSRRSTSIGFDYGLAITELSPNKGAAWAFVRTILDKERQLTTIGYRFPTNQAAYDQRAASALIGDYWSDYATVGGAVPDPSDFEDAIPLTQADLDQINSFINSTSGAAGWSMDDSIWNMISEEASQYFKEISTAEHTAQVIQSKVQILVSERS